MQWFKCGLLSLFAGFSDEGAGPLLSARGEAIVLRTKEDSFMIEEKATGSHEV